MPNLIVDDGAAHGISPSASGALEVVVPETILIIDASTSTTTLVDVAAPS